MIREACSDDLKELLELYLFLHEEDMPEDNAHLRDFASLRASDTTISVLGLFSLPLKKPASSLRISSGISLSELRDE